MNKFKPLTYDQTIKRLRREYVWQDFFNSDICDKCGCKFKNKTYIFISMYKTPAIFVPSFCGMKCAKQWIGPKESWSK